MGLGHLLGWLGRRQVGTYTGEVAVPIAGSSIVVLCRLGLEQLGLEMETSAHH
jgi:hypothetical protein